MMESIEYASFSFSLLPDHGVGVCMGSSDGAVQGVECGHILQISPPTSGIYISTSYSFLPTHNEFPSIPP